MANQITISETNFCVGDIIRVTQLTKEKDKDRLTFFEGKVMGIKGRSPNKSFTVRRIGVDNVGVEKIFLATAPSISKIEIKKKGDVRRAKLYYLRKQIVHR
jgi:large subunit ribosomal protein L19